MIAQYVVPIICEQICCFVLFFTGGIIAAVVESENVSS